MLINNSGVNPDPSRQRFDGKLDYSEWAETMNVNVFGVVRVIQALLPSLLLSQQRKLIYISSNAGSISTQRLGAREPGRTQLMYRSSKAALNMVAKLIDVELAGQVGTTPH